MELLRVYLDPAEIGEDGYPYAWHSSSEYGPYKAGHSLAHPAIKDLVRMEAGHRCVRCSHPYRKGEHGNGEWSPCDGHCTHHDDGPVRLVALSAGGNDGVRWSEGDVLGTYRRYNGGLDIARAGWEHDLNHGLVELQAQWRVLTVHHLNGIKHDCRWWNLAALCQRCHLTIQGRVVMERPYNRPHSDWFKPYVAGFYASLLGEEISREEAVARMDELLGPHELQRTLEGL